MKIYHITAILFILLLILNFILTKPNPTIRITSAKELEELFSNPQEDINVKLASSVYELNFENRLKTQKEWINRITILEASDFFHDFIE